MLENNKDLLWTLALVLLPVILLIFFTWKRELNWYKNPPKKLSKYQVAIVLVVMLAYLLLVTL
ncbi:MAG: hypothetical protein A3I07_00600 [Candidatus Doudnabacteria bacterium RIFCSPLOWO2_02_FULL_42_9]|uniref:Uncharacterized protein n=1 Tax=Candidatus Doudnabacteria bacterium RIFCSPHIGHO2_01_FULL_41_86 TaxID=1817821 RepID=A0A1F5N8U6_9BACT|nr:MAG: hypothetical protein A2717_04430 [Candidatus Doudnabacteria bacterium RIFCSPHIGHO2_01_FULL_41_86]OGE75859.1 MAG: hypothetical protein A3K07_04025 [Candidatus Doudnabacteria bacterium RIFCSPHIGHO2_01_43_10]OGE86233.1 MAG: hypothetical protein A3E28_03785 [Candidatus Doudnabacteria bacterium RIFCSPHIGHO2_12_FULL_42_22]OGE87082.1 MAG: hypothetical protein A3C49_03455 [Candidatus Doudnabacteria bacterium RIFCSPHIGHO2_02_FULL_42_25]OGE92221.1 MAG: hypothetical protein A2895_04135 [Candidatus